MLSHPVKLRVEVVGEFREPQGSLRGGTIMSEEQETPERKGSNFS